jgi:hypothetical protein
LIQTDGKKKHDRDKAGSRREEFCSTEHEDKSPENRRLNRRKTMTKAELKKKQDEERATNKAVATNLAVPP